MPSQHSDLVDNQLRLGQTIHKRKTEMEGEEETALRKTYLSPKDFFISDTNSLRSVGASLGASFSVFLNLLFSFMLTNLPPNLQL